MSLQVLDFYGARAGLEFLYKCLYSFILISGNFIIHKNVHEFRAVVFPTFSSTRPGSPTFTLPTKLREADLADTHNHCGDIFRPPSCDTFGKLYR